MLDNQQLQQLYQYCFSLTAHTADAQDLLHTAIEKWLLMDKAKRLSVQQPLAYIRRIIRYQFIDDCRRLKRIAFDPLEDNAPALVDERRLDDMVIDELQLQYLWQQLNTAEREVLYLWAVLEYSAKEISEATGQPRGSVLSRLYRLREKVKRLTPPDQHPASEVNL